MLVISTKFIVGDLLNLTEKDKYATAIAGFETIDTMNHLEFPKKVNRSKLAVKSMYALKNQLLQWDFIDENAREALREELGLRLESKAEETLESSSTPSDTANKVQEVKNKSNSK